MAEHIRLRSCESIEEPLDWGKCRINGTEEKALKARKSHWGEDEVMKWKGIWRILFPLDSNIPRPSKSKISHSALVKNLTYFRHSDPFRRRTSH
jgi:hypothetical protein